MSMLKAAPAAVALFIASPAFAADDDIVVLGQRGARAPAAAQTFDARDLAARGVQSVDELAAAAPGVHMINDQDPGTNIIAIRGVTSDRLQQAAIAFLQDGIALADPDLFTLPTFDLARAEVVRGPQGARFGRNAAAGVIALFPAEAGLGRVEASLGNGALRRLEAARGWGDDAQSLRVAGLWSAADGWIENQTLDKVVDAHEVRAGRVIGRARLGPVTARARVEGYWEDGGAAWASSGDVTGHFGGRLDGAALSDPIGDFEGRAKRRWVQTALRLEGPLAGGEARLDLARDLYAKRWVEELDYRPGPLTFFGAPIFPNGLQPISQPTDIEAWTAEARWGRALGPFEIGLGGFRQDVDRQRTDDFGPLLFGAAAPRYHTDSAQSAVFASLAWSGETLRLEAQARFDREERTQTIASSADGRVLDRRALSDERLQPRLAASWTPRPGVTAYAAYGEAYRAGGFNPAPTAGAVWQIQFKPETAQSLEAGVRLGGGDLRAELGGFFTRLSDYQNYTFLDGSSVTLNVDDAEIRGLEASGQAAADVGSWRLEADVGLGVANGEIVRFRAPDPIVAGQTRDYSGNRLPNAPLWTGSAGLSVERPALAGAVSVGVRLHGAGETLFEIDNALRSPAKAWADARIAYREGDWTMSLWAKNLTNERWAISAFGQGMLPLLAGLGPGGPFDTYTLNRGRQWGVSLSRSLAP